jgi:hypothetical protein
VSGLACALEPASRELVDDNVMPTRAIAVWQSRARFRIMMPAPPGSTFVERRGLSYEIAVKEKSEIGNRPTSYHVMKAQAPLGDEAVRFAVSIVALVTAVAIAFRYFF